MTDLVPVWLVTVAFSYFAVRITIFDQIGSIKIFIDLIGLFIFLSIGLVLLGSYLR
ncbi:hypothetical protein PT287_09715 [Lactobacillus sp. ESL0679]|uniref:hypothetical protein n=1 Tax=Lactobacillus sp. ESL0679 TaxID=2983209 RepID=UPI0023F8139E|nr:hypothetical protein [Lactobacillus sp. ESL0679]MDF7683774.1 hypothetical protein [Lactobacillus sp. ESL0679]